MQVANSRVKTGPGQKAQTTESSHTQTGHGKGGKVAKTWENKTDLTKILPGYVRLAWEDGSEGKVFAV